MLEKLRNNEDGVVFIMVLAIILVMLVLTLSVISMNVSQAQLQEREIKRVNAEIVATGALGHIYTTQIVDPTTTAISYTQTLDNHDYTVSATVSPPSGATFGSNGLNVNVSY